MRGGIPHLPNKPSWRGPQLKQRDFKQTNKQTKNNVCLYTLLLWFCSPAPKITRFR